MRTFNVFEAEFEYDDSDPAGYKAGNHRFGPKVGGQRLGATVYELPPGESLMTPDASPRPPSPGRTV